MAKDNRTLGRFILDGIPPAPRGIPQVEVAFDIDANGIVNVHAKDKATNKEQHITITASSGLSKDEINKLVKDAQSHEADDKKRREEIEQKNQADSLAYATEKTLKENRDKIPEDERKKVEAVLEDLKKAIEANDSGKIKSGMEALTQTSHKMAEALYKASTAKPEEAPKTEGSPPPPEEPAAGSKDDNVVDAEFTESKD
jgi:molecular chaperone DnaK